MSSAIILLLNNWKFIEFCLFLRFYFSAAVYSKLFSMSDNNKPKTTENPNETNQDISGNVLGVNIMIDELSHFILKKINEGKEEKLIKQHVLNYIDSHKIILQEIYNWLLNNQNHLNSIYLLGYFNYHGIETNINKQNAYNLYQKAAELGNDVAQFNLANMFIDGKGVDQNYDKAFELSNKFFSIFIHISKITLSKTTP